MSLLKIEQVTKRFGGVLALDRVSFAIREGTIVSLIGPNGAGKTTLFNCVTGVIRLEEGTLIFSGRQKEHSLEGLPPYAITRLGIARTFQNIRLFAQMTVLENVLVGTYVRTATGFWEALWPMNVRARREQRWAIEEGMRLLNELGLGSYADSPATALPYGQQRRLELARALAADPRLLLLDEPAAGLTHAERQELMAFLQQLKRSGRTILLIEHDMKVVMPISDWVVVLDYAEKIAEGPPQEIQENPKVIEAYLGVRAA